MSVTIPRYRGYTPFPPPLEIEEWERFPDYRNKGLSDLETLGRYMRFSTLNSIVIVVHDYASIREMAEQFVGLGFVAYLAKRTVAIDLVKFPRVIVNVNNLGNLLTTDGEPVAPDLLALVGTESIVEKLCSGTVDRFESVYSALNSLILRSCYIFVMDANAGQRTASLIKRRRKSSPYSLFIYSRNAYFPRIHHTYYATSCAKAWEHYLIKDLNKKRRIVVPAGSVTVAKSLIRRISARFPKKIIRLYAGSTDEEILEIMRDTRTKCEIDVLIYTPDATPHINLGAGNDFDKVHAYFDSESCSMQSCYYTFDSIHSLGVDTAHIYIENSCPDRRMTYTEIQANICRGSTNLGAISGANHLRRDTNGKCIREDDYLDLVVTNHLATNYIRSDMYRVVANMLEAAGGTIVPLETKKL